MNSHRILMVDGDPVVRDLVRTNLEARGYDTFLALDIAEARRIIHSESPEIIILDLMPPAPAGLEMCSRIRMISRAFILVLIAESDESFKAKCFGAGADDCIVKPFGVEELIARIKAVLRRGDVEKPVPPNFSNSFVDIDFAERRVYVAGREVHLTPIEYNLLEQLALKPDKVIGHQRLLGAVWGQEHVRDREYLRVIVGRLRKKLETEPNQPPFIVTIPWVGYKLNPALPGRASYVAERGIR